MGCIQVGNIKSKKISYTKHSLTSNIKNLKSSSAKVILTNQPNRIEENSKIIDDEIEKSKRRDCYDGNSSKLILKENQISIKNENKSNYARSISQQNSKYVQRVKKINKKLKTLERFENSNRILISSRKKSYSSPENKRVQLLNDFQLLNTTNDNYKGKSTKLLFKHPQDFCYERELVAYMNKGRPIALYLNSKDQVGNKESFPKKERQDSNTDMDSCLLIGRIRDSEEWFNINDGVVLNPQSSGRLIIKINKKLVQTEVNSVEQTQLKVVHIMEGIVEIYKLSDLYRSILKQVDNLSIEEKELLGLINKFRSNPKSFLLNHLMYHKDIIPKFDYVTNRLKLVETVPCVNYDPDLHVDKTQNCFLTMENVGHIEVLSQTNSPLILLIKIINDDCDKILNATYRFIGVSIKQSLNFKWQCVINFK